MADSHARILSGMRVTGKLHLGHYHGVIKNWIKLQYEYECYFMVADLHGLTTNYTDVHGMQEFVKEMVLDWLACGVDPSQSTIFLQSDVPAHSELYLLLSMITPISWLERVPTYKEQLDKLAHKDINTYGFLGYPLLQAADILLYNPKFVPVGEDQVCHVELTREIARRFNYIYGREVGFEAKAYEAMKQLGHKKSKLYKELLIKYQQDGETDALIKAQYLLQDAVNIVHSDKERLLAFLENKSNKILVEPQELLTKNSRLIGLDGAKMSKSYGNTIAIREHKDEINKKIKSMTTDPARIRRNDPGDPNKCPVFELHKIYNNKDNKLEEIQQACTKAAIGCVECKNCLVDGIVQEQNAINEKAKEYLEDPHIISKILAEGSARARVVADNTLENVKQAMGLI